MVHRKVRERPLSVLPVLCAALVWALCGASPAAAEPAHVVFVLDASGSMWGQIEGRP